MRPCLVKKSGHAVRPARPIAAAAPPRVEAAAAYGGSDDRRLSGAYGNIGYMGPGLALTTLGPAANVPVALIFCFDTLVLFALVPFLMTLSGPRPQLCYGEFMQTLTNS